MKKYDICVIAEPEDAQIAELLAGRIHSYRLPRGVVLQDSQADYRKIYVDSTGAPFSSEVRERLDDSRYLIVICSPAAKQSEAIRKRLVYFKEIRRDEDIVAVIVRGEPVDSFPELFIERKLVRHIMPDMRIIEREETIEPVAADLRGDTPKRREQLLRYETVRITASVLGLHPDALEQRHRARRKHAIAAAVAVVCAVLLTAAGIFARLGLIAQKEGNIARQQTVLSVAAAERLTEELPGMFADNPQALTYIDAAVSEAQDALAEIDKLNSAEG